MKEKGITLSPTHGVNPSVAQCFYCLKEKNEVLLFGRLPGDAEAPRIACIDRTPCDECGEWMKKGILFISVDESKTTGSEEPYRSGGFCVLKEDAVKRMGFEPPELVEKIFKMRHIFLPDEIWDLLGLPRGDAK